ncbi:hypothetical protein, partial [Legionella parisiensis]|uniref:hypothetical protein n=1 Tax=Legionella parisiensis TaxID=45071 RepID=UPI001F0B20CB
MKNRAYTPKDHLEAAASQLLTEGKKKVNQLYEDGIHKANEVEDNLKEQSDRVLKKSGKSIGFCFDRRRNRLLVISITEK